MALPNATLRAATATFGGALGSSHRAGIKAVTRKLRVERRRVQTQDSGRPGLNAAGLLKRRFQDRSFESRHFSEEIEILAGKNPADEVSGVEVVRHVFPVYPRRPSLLDNILNDLLQFTRVSRPTMPPKQLQHFT